MVSSACASLIRFTWQCRGCGLLSARSIRQLSGLQKCQRCKNSVWANCLSCPLSKKLVKKNKRKQKQGFTQITENDEFSTAGVAQARPKLGFLRPQSLFMNISMVHSATRYNQRLAAKLNSSASIMKARKRAESQKNFRNRSIQRNLVMQGKLSSFLLRFSCGNPRRDPGNSHSLLKFSEKWIGIHANPFHRHADTRPVCSHALNCNETEESHFQDFAHVCPMGAGCERKSTGRCKYFFHPRYPQCRYGADCKTYTSLEEWDEEHAMRYQHPGQPFIRKLCKFGDSCKSTRNQGRT